MKSHKVIHQTSKYNLRIILLISSLFSFSQVLATNENKENFVLHHIADSHEWHFATIYKTPITVPLPIIIVSKKNGLEIFSSNRFLGKTHNKISYRGYSLNSHDKIIAVDSSKKFYDLSITKNIASMFISLFIMLIIILSAAKRYKKNIYTIPRGFWNLLELIICFVRDEIAIPNIGLTQHMKFMPYLLSIFFFIWLNNLMGLLPGSANVTGNISVTLVLSLFTFVLTLVNGNKYYWGHVFNPPGVPKWLTPIMVPVEILGLFTKPFSLMIRLFANITAGHIILLSIIGIIFILRTALIGIISVPFGAFMFLLKLVVAFLQAYVFTLLSAIYLGMAVETHE